MGSKSRRPRILSRRSDFLRTQRQGKRFHAASWLTVNLLHNNTSHMRFGWTIPKYVGNAVLRNRFKRWIREEIRVYEKERREDRERFFDVNFVFRRKDKDFYKNLSHDDVKKAVQKVFRYIEKRR